MGATQRYPPRSRRLCCRGRGAHPFHTEQNREPSAAVALLLWRVLAQGSTTWEPRRGPTWAGRRPEGSVGGGRLATTGVRDFWVFRGSHPGSPLRKGPFTPLCGRCSPARAGGLTFPGGGLPASSRQALPHGPLIRGLGGPWPPQRVSMEESTRGLRMGAAGSSTVWYDHRGPSLDDCTVEAGATRSIRRVFYCHKVAFL